MPQEKYLTDVDEALVSFVKKQNKTIINKIAFSAEKVKSGSFKKIAYDVYRVDNDPYESLWLYQDFEDGPYLVRAVDSVDDLTKKNGEWDALTDKSGENITLLYKNVPISRFSSSEFKFNAENLLTFKSALLDQITNNTDFLKSILKNEPAEKVSAIVTSFPEFKKFI